LPKETPRDSKPKKKQSNPGPANAKFIWQIGRATSAAHTYFEPIMIGSDYFSDGGVGYNNPSEEVYYEVLYKEEERRSSNPIDLFLSIGTGADDEEEEDDKQNNTRKHRVSRSIFKHLSGLSKLLTGHATDVETVNERMQRFQFQGDRKMFDYYRWSGGKKLSNLKMDEWKLKTDSKKSTQEMIEEWVQEYMANPQRQIEVQDVAKALVQRRRRRCADLDKWPRFSHCTRVRCTWCSNNDTAMRNTRAELVDHCREAHAHQYPHDDLERHIATHPLRRPRIDGGPF
jgi:hypothetical protein